MKGNYEIKKLYGSAGRGYESGGRICPFFVHLHYIRPHFHKIDEKIKLSFF